MDNVGSRCGDKVDTLKVSWPLGNSFAMNFVSNTSKYDMTSLVVTLNASSLFNDSAGECFAAHHDDLSVCFISDFFFS